VQEVIDENTFIIFVCANQIQQEKRQQKILSREGYIWWNQGLILCEELLTKRVKMDLFIPGKGICWAD